MNQPKFLHMNLQTFAEPTDPPADPPKDPQDPPANPPADPPKTFTQEELDAIVKERLGRAKKKAEEEAERKRLEEEGKIKELYDKTKADLEALQKQLHEKEVDDLKTKTILAAGYTAEQLDFVKKLVTGETEAEFATAIEEAKKFIPVPAKGADPSPGNPPRTEPPAKTDEDFGRQLFQRLRGKK